MNKINVVIIVCGIIATVFALGVVAYMYNWMERTYHKQKKDYDRHINEIIKKTEARVRKQCEKEYNKKYYNWIMCAKNSTEESSKMRELMLELESEKLQLEDHNRRLLEYIDSMEKESIGRKERARHDRMVAQIYSVLYSYDIDFKKEMEEQSCENQEQ